MDISQYKHKYQIKVRNYEIDWQGIVHNGNYLLYFEVARVNYFKDTGMEIDERSISGNTKIVVARNELDYYNPATYDDLLDIYTRITAINNSSIRCEAEMVLTEKNIPIAKCITIHVWVDPVSNKPVPVPNYYRKKIQEFEEGRAAILWPSIEV